MSYVTDPQHSTAVPTCEPPVDVSAANASATESYLGYLYQGCFALTVLLDASDGESVSVETQDDVVLHGAASGVQPTLHQLKHSRTPGRPITVKNDGFWKTLGLWVADYRRAPGRYVFVTAAPLAPGSVLALLAITDSERGSVVAALLAEAERVRDARAKDTMQNRHLHATRGSSTPSPAGDKTDALRYGRRAAGTEAFLSLTPVERADLVRRIAIMPSTFQIGQVDDAIEQRLRTFVLPQHRASVGRRLRAWWDRRITLALLEEQPRRVEKNELLDCLQNLVAEERELNLPDDYSTIDAPPEVTADRESPLVRQIELVDGKASRIRRALEVRWKAREQRRQWMDRDVALAPLLHSFDQRLVRAWQARFGPMCDDCESSEAAEKTRRGCELLDWSHLIAPREVEALRPEWRKDFYTQGAYQQLADELQVGWHPEYLSLLAAHAAGNGAARAITSTAHALSTETESKGKGKRSRMNGPLVTRKTLGGPISAPQADMPHVQDAVPEANGETVVAPRKRLSRRAKNLDGTQITMRLDLPLETVKGDAEAPLRAGDSAPILRRADR